MTERLFFNPYLKLSKNKTLELQSGIWKKWNYFDLSIKLNRHTDHVGVMFNIETFGLYFIFQVYDHRHWDWENNCWEGQAPEPTPETRPHYFNEDGTTKFVSPGISTRACD
jgi:hypothetical protein